MKWSKWAAGLEGFLEEEWDPLGQNRVNWSLMLKKSMSEPNVVS